jgi:ABC-type antimicrobial peptide transport system permease subunit
MSVVGTARGFPGMTTDPLLVVSAPALRTLSPEALHFATQVLWLKGPQQSALSKLLAAKVQVRYVTTVSSVSAAPSLEAVLQTLDILRAFGIVGAALLLMGIAIYVDVRSRRRRLASVLTRRMGLRPRTDWLSNWLELGTAAGAGLAIGAAAGVGLAAYVTSLLDPVPDAPPGPLVVHPWPLVVGMVVALASATALIAALGLRRGSTVDAAVLRAE